MKNILGLLFLGLLFTGCKTKQIQTSPPENFSYNETGKGALIELQFTKGKAHNHPLMAVWAEEPDGTFIQTLFVAQSIGKGVFEHGDASTGRWLAGEIRRPASLPVWAHKRGVVASDGLYIPDSKNPVPDAYTGATPSRDFIMNLRLDEPRTEAFVVFFEINQTWDWNEYWTNNKYPEDNEYKTSCQPAVVYKGLANPTMKNAEVQLQAIGHSHYSGKDGTVYDGLNTLTTALDIASEIKIIIR